ncbi:hypothetical protein GCM10010975_28010 [Comamonas phosphati]|nr:hypothetical protein GCM10010975_28010 [Comamonas phosphati]
MAALLYAGAAMAGILSRRHLDQKARLARGDWPRLLWMAAFGSVLH